MTVVVKPMLVLRVLLVCSLLALAGVDGKPKVLKRGGAKDGNGDERIVSTDTITNGSETIGNLSSGSQSKEEMKETATSSRPLVLIGHPFSANSGSDKGLPCQDQFADAYCKNRLLRRGKQHCKKDFYFGRLQCCGTCSKAWGAPNGNETDFANSNATWAMPCADHVAPDGTSFTGWCQEFTSAAKNHTIFSCNRSLFVKFRCMKTCGLC